MARRPPPGRDEQAERQGARPTPSSTGRRTRTSPSACSAPASSGSVHQSNTVLAGSLALNGNHTSQSCRPDPGRRLRGLEPAGGRARRPRTTRTPTPTRTPTSTAPRTRTCRSASSATETTATSASRTRWPGSPPRSTATRRRSPPRRTQAGCPEPLPVLDPYGDPARSSPPTRARACRRWVRSRTTSRTPTRSRPPRRSTSRTCSVPVRIGSPGDDGSTTQANAVSRLGIAANGNKTTRGQPDQAGSGGTLVQGIGQIAQSKQDALACADAAQKGAKNTNAPCASSARATTARRASRTPLPRSRRL